ncbi:helix-turn-helix domain-containing protein [Cupriavidus sp. M-11]|uniref:helix-turn-helix domain-containing protein n=1 Tax=Cupriavidus sp. M-11 TaxID=3233038 RepID=UPI003F8EAEC2
MTAKRLTFAELLHLIRKRSGLPQKAVAQRCGIDPSYLAAMEAGRKGVPSRLVLEALVTAMSAADEERGQLYRAACAERLGREIDQIFPADIRTEATELIATVARLKSWEIRTVCQLAKAFEDREAEGAI